MIQSQTSTVKRCYERGCTARLKGYTDVIVAYKAYRTINFILCLHRPFFQSLQSVDEFLPASTARRDKKQLSLGLTSLFHTAQLCDEIRNSTGHKVFENIAITKLVASPANNNDIWKK
ncbi:hypothetical protein TNCV_536351 [Trichonephila clavipes]|nr:hypothetical protein TNCV_536351 [Trichonephila clavipes]